MKGILMKKLFAFMAVMAAMTAVSNVSAQTRFSLGAGAAVNMYHISENAEKSVKSAPGLSLDFEADFALKGNFSLSAGAGFAGVAGYHFGGNKKMNLGEIYLDIPLRAKYHIPFNPGTNLYFFAGVVPNICLVSIDAHSSGTKSFFNTIPTLRRAGVMLGGGVGMEIIDHIRLSVAYDHDLIDKVGAADVSCRRGAVKVVAYYIF